MSRIILSLNGAHQIANNFLFVVRRNKEGIAMLLFCRRKLYISALKYQQDVNKLIEIRQRKEQKEYEVKDNNWRDCHTVELEHNQPPHQA